MQRGIGVEDLEHFRVGLGVAVFGNPVSADGKFVVSEHIGDGDLADYRSVKVRSLQHAGCDEVAAVAAAAYGELLGVGVFVLD